MKQKVADESGTAAQEFLLGAEGFGGGPLGDEIEEMYMYLRLGTPISTVLLASSTGHDDSFGILNKEVIFPMVEMVGTKCDKVRSDMVVYEICGGGSIFSVGSINWFCSLDWDNDENNVANITWNLLNNFIRRGDEKHNCQR